MAKIHLIGAAAVVAAVAAGCCDKKECDAEPAKAPAAVQTPTAQPAAEPAKDPNEVVMSVGGERLVRKDLDADVDRIVKNMPPERQVAAKRNVATQLVQQFLFSSALCAKAKKLGYELTDEDMKQRNEEYRKSVAGRADAPQSLEALAETSPVGKERAMAEIRRNALIDKLIKAEVLDKDTTDYAKDAAEIIKGIEDRNASKLSDEEALAKINELKKSLDETPEDGKAAKFAELAREHSGCPTGKKSGGDLNFFGRKSMVPEFEKAAYELEVGKISGPVKTSYGYHLIYKTGEDKENDLCRASHILLLTGEKDQVPDAETVVNTLKSRNNRNKIHDFIGTAIREANPVAADEFKFMLPPPQEPQVPAAEPAKPTPAPEPAKPGAEPAKPAKAVIESEPVEIPAQPPVEIPAEK